MQTENVLIDIVDEILVNCINQRSVDTIMPKMEQLLHFFGSGSDVIGCDWREPKFHQNWRWLLFLVVATRLSCKTMCTVTAKQRKCRLLVLNTNIQNVAAGFALFTVVETSSFIG